MHTRWLTLLGIVLFASIARPSPAAALQDPRVGREPSPPSDMLDMQVRLDRLGFSPGEIDGEHGRNTEQALKGFQRAKGLEPSGAIDSATAGALAASAAGPVIVPYTITPEDVAGPFVPEIPADLMEQASLASLGYTSALEMLGERFHASPRVLRQLNPAATFAAAGEVIRVPNVPEPPVLPPSTGASQEVTAPGAAGIVITVSKEAGVLTVRDAGGAQLFQAPVTVGSEHDPLPIGDWTVTSVTLDPLFNYNPELFWDADPSHAKAQIKSGPNNPVGVVWIALSREHYGIHGTPEPGRIGHTESHGCVRLTNWDALRVASFAGRGTRVRFME